MGYRLGIPTLAIRDPMTTASIDIRHMRYFVSVAEEGSFRSAATRLFISQPALTRQVQQLEVLLDAVLLIRRPRGIELTDAGRVFYSDAKNLLEMLGQTASRTKLASQGQSGRLDIGIFGSAIFVAIPRIVKAFKDRFPDVLVALHTMDRAEQVQALRERRLTMGFDSCYKEEEGLTWQPIQKERMHFALHESHPLARRSTLNLSDIAKDPLIIYPRTPRSEPAASMLALFHRRQLSPVIIQEVDDLTTAVALVSNGFGATLVTDSACAMSVPNVVYRPIAAADKAVFDLCMIYRAENSTPLLREFIKTACNLRPVLAATAQKSKPTRM